MMTTDIHKPIPETFRDLKRMNFTWFHLTSMDANRIDAMNYFKSLVPEDERLKFYF
jgi:hypothetical protein